ncbi:HEAT repeat domain-containing protein [Frondihabitans australicus]|uniref:HEAT repeat protein n=1 Tax=Frondihabitans australicus TaxID=386892 RepID=A0A495IGG7_9MICO|nr:HEAT repeat domain-containing protein [Frondihabitans australicus]RKR75044.1 HEAT repeat protein [Frondihabitans australicus]
MSTLDDALRDPRSSTRLRAVMAAGSTPDEGDVATLVAQCATEPDFFVRDMLTWALTRHDPALVVPILLQELANPTPQARSQALHTLSKIGDRATFDDVAALLTDPVDDVARAAWRAAVALGPDETDVDGRRALAARLATQLGRGDGQTRLSLSRAFAALGPDAVETVLVDAATSTMSHRAEHAAEALRVVRDPDSASALAVDAARREVALGRTRGAKG